MLTDDMQDATACAGPVPQLLQQQPELIQSELVNCTSRDVRERPAKGFGALVSVCCPMTLTLYPGSHKNVPRHDKLHIVHRREKRYIRAGGGGTHLILFFNSGLIHAGYGRERLLEEWEEVKVENQGSGGESDSACPCCRSGRNWESWQLDAHLEKKGYQPMCRSCEVKHGGLRLHFYAEEGSDTDNTGRRRSPKKRLKVGSTKNNSPRKASRKGDTLLCECGKDCEECPPNLVTEITTVPGGGGGAPGVIHGNLDIDGYCIWDTKEQVFFQKDLTVLPSKEGWQTIFNNVKLHSKPRRMQLPLDALNPFVFRSKPTIALLELCKKASYELSKLLKLEGLQVINPALLRSDLGVLEQDIHRDWPRSACLGN